MTPAEGRIAALVAEGRTNREVAAALFLTEQTVATALTRVYRKLGVRSRAELARRLAANAGAEAGKDLRFLLSAAGRRADAPVVNERGGLVKRRIYIPAAATAIVLLVLAARCGVRTPRRRRA